MQSRSVVPTGGRRTEEQAPDEDELQTTSAFARVLDFMCCPRAQLAAAANWQERSLLFEVEIRCSVCFAVIIGVEQQRTSEIRYQLAILAGC